MGRERKENKKQDAEETVVIDKASQGLGAQDWMDT